MLLCCDVFKVDHSAVAVSAMLRQGSDCISLKSPFFLAKQSFLCFVVMKVGRVVKNMNSQLLMKKKFQIFLKSGTECTPKNFIFN